MIAATYDCGCIPHNITHTYPNCLKSHSHDQTQQKYTLLRCHHAIPTSSYSPPPPPPRNSCCKRFKQNTINCRNAISSCPNFDKIHNCTCSSESPKKHVEISQIPDDCNCKLKESKDCNEEQLDLCTTEKKSRIISDITKKGLPYKEIEAIINDNHMVIRVQKEHVQDEFEPPCDCPNDPGILSSKSDEQIQSSGSPKCRNDIVYEMSDLSKSGYKYTGQNSTIKQSCDQSGKGGRTITVYPHPGILQKIPDNPQDDKDKKKLEKTKITKPQIDLEENPNIFVLRIRKMSRNVDGKHKLDLEFRAPRPWINRTFNEPIKRPAIHLQTNSDINEQQGVTTNKKKRKHTGEKKKIVDKEKK